MQISPILLVMNFLLLDTADARGCVAVFRDEESLLTLPHSAAEDFSSWLLPAVEQALAQSGLSLSNLDGYAVCSGPGSFTGLRVGLTTVKAWAEIYRKPIAPISRLEALAAAGITSLNPRPPFTAIFSDARRGQVFAALYDASGTPVEPETVISIETFLSRAEAICGTSPILWKTPDSTLLETLPQWPCRQAKGDLLERVEPPFAAQLGALAYQKFLQGKTTDSLALDANYVRRSDAELFWKDHATAVKA
jgi:tRNA threonylcarbamoyladenosine biosynthesis protein TsaB